MNTNLQKLLLEWPLPVIRDADITTAVQDSASKRYAVVNRALKKKTLLHLRRGFYLVGKPYLKTIPSNFEIAHYLYGLSYISFESALVYHQWIPEAVYSTTCATGKRSREFTTPLGVFQYLHVPERFCYLGVKRLGSDLNAHFIADPWKALADHYYVFNRNWNHPEDLCEDMRIEMETLENSDLNLLSLLSKHYQNRKVRLFLSKILRSLDPNGN